MVIQIDRDVLAKTLGRHTRLSQSFSWTIAGVPVDLEADGYAVQVWVLKTDGTTLIGPRTANVSGSTATYVMQVGDLDVASDTSTDPALIVARADNVDQTLISDARAITVGDWPGADG